MKVEKYRSIVLFSLFLTTIKPLIYAMFFLITIIIIYKRTMLYMYLGKLLILPLLTGMSGLSEELLIIFSMRYPIISSQRVYINSFVEKLSLFNYTLLLLNISMICIGLLVLIVEKASRKKKSSQIEKY